MSMAVTEVTGKVGEGVNTEEGRGSEEGDG